MNIILLVGRFMKQSRTAAFVAGRHAVEGTEQSGHPSYCLKPGFDQRKRRSRLAVIIRNSVESP